MSWIVRHSCKCGGFRCSVLLPPDSHQGEWGLHFSLYLLPFIKCECIYRCLAWHWKPMVSLLIHPLLFRLWCNFCRVFVSSLATITFSVLYTIHAHMYVVCVENHWHSYLIANRLHSQCWIPFTFVFSPYNCSLSFSLLSFSITENCLYNWESQIRCVNGWSASPAAVATTVSSSSPFQFVTNGFYWLNEFTVAHDWNLTEIDTVRQTLMDHHCASSKTSHWTSWCCINAVSCVCVCVCHRVVFKLNSTNKKIAVTSNMTY